MESTRLYGGCTVWVIVISLVSVFKSIRWLTMTTPNMFYLGSFVDSPYILVPIPAAYMHQIRLRCTDDAYSTRQKEK